MAQLDRNRYYAHIYGDPVKKYRQDGVDFRGDGTPINSPKPAVTPKPAEAEETTTTEEAVQVVDQKADEREEGLKAMHISKLKSIATQVSKETETEAPQMSGKGLKKNLIAYILENTE